jgi:hypothetical protein
LETVRKELDARLSAVESRQATPVTRKTLDLQGNAGQGSAPAVLTAQAPPVPEPTAGVPAKEDQPKPNSNVLSVGQKPREGAEPSATASLASSKVPPRDDGASSETEDSNPSSDDDSTASSQQQPFFSAPTARPQEAVRESSEPTIFPDFLASTSAEGIVQFIDALKTANMKNSRNGKRPLGILECIQPGTLAYLEQTGKFRTEEEAEQTLLRLCAFPTYAEAIAHFGRLRLDVRQGATALHAYALAFERAGRRAASLHIPRKELVRLFSAGIAPVKAREYFDGQVRRKRASTFAKLVRIAQKMISTLAEGRNILDASPASPAQAPATARTATTPPAASAFATSTPDSTSTSTSSTTEAAQKTRPHSDLPHTRGAECAYCKGEGFRFYRGHTEEQCRNKAEGRHRQSRLSPSAEPFQPSSPPAPPSAKASIQRIAEPRPPSPPSATGTTTAVISVERKAVIRQGTKFLAVTRSFDSGACATFIHPAIASQLSTERIEPPLQFSLANSASLTVSAAANIGIMINGQYVECRAYVLPDAADELIVGRPQMAAFFYDAATDTLVPKSTATEGDPCLPASPSSPTAQQVVDVSNDLAATVFDQLMQQQFARLKQHPINFATPAKFPPMEINLDKQPIPQAKRTYNPKVMAAMKEQVAQMLRDGIMIDPTGETPMVSNLLAVRQNGKIRVCADLTNLNDATTDDKTVSPSSEEIFMTLRGCRYFTKIDLSKAYWQCLLAEMCRKWTAVYTPFGVKVFARVPFGLKNAPTYFDKCMRSAFRDDDPDRHLFFDDILVASMTRRGHVDAVTLAIDILLRHNLQANADKCIFGASEIEYLGFIISEHGRSISPSRIAALTALQPPRSQKEAQRIAGLFNFFRAFVPGYAVLATPLTAAAATEQFRGSEEADRSFYALRDALVHAVTLAVPNFDQAFDVHSDASDVGCGASLTQDGLPLGFFSYTWTEAEAKYNTTEHECLGCVLACEHFEPITDLCKVNLYTDHENLKYMAHSKNKRVERWFQRLGAFDYTVKEIPGKANTAADALSRAPLPTAVVGAITRSMTRQDAPATPVQASTTTPSPPPQQQSPTPSPAPLSLATTTLTTVRAAAITDEERRWLSLHNAVPRDGCYYVGTALFVPASAQPVRSALLVAAHELPLSGHAGINKTVSRLQQVATWPQLVHDVQQFIVGCIQCQREGHHVDPNGPYATFQARGPFDVLHVDLVGPDTVDELGNTMTLSCVDHFTRFAILVPLANATSRTVAEALWRYVFCVFGIPRILFSDNGTQFCSDLMDQLAKLLQFKQTFAATYHPQSNGLVEQQNGTIRRMMRALIDGYPDIPWSLHLPAIQFALNTSTSRVSGLTPAEIVFGHQLRAPLHALTETAPSSSPVADEYLQSLQASLAQLYTRLEKAHAQPYEPRRQITFDAGQYAWLYDETPGKTTYAWHGPVQVISTVRSNVCEVQDLVTKRKQQVHVERLRPFDHSRVPVDDVLKIAARRGALYVTEAIREHRKNQDGSTSILVKWLGWPESANTWEPFGSIARTREVLDYATAHGLAL